MPEEEVLLVVHGWYSVCGACKKQTSPTWETHEEVTGYSSIRNPQPGCGAKFTHITSGLFDYPGGMNNRTIERLMEMRPDLPVKIQKV